MSQMVVVLGILLGVAIALAADPTGRRQSVEVQRGRTHHGKGRKGGQGLPPPMYQHQLGVLPET